MIYGNGSEFKLHFHDLCKTYGVKRKATSIKNPTANAILERIYAVFTNMLCLAKLDMAELVNASAINFFLVDGTGQFVLPTIQYQKPHKVQQYLDEICYLTFRS
jgi:hypothetical protein